jgi:hypothetical protein
MVGGGILHDRQWLAERLLAAAAVAQEGVARRPLDSAPLSLNRQWNDQRQ